MEFRILGPLDVVENGHRVEVGGGKQRALLAILLLHANQVVSTGRLIDWLWGERPPPTAPKALQRMVSQLRRVLGEGVLVTRAPGYSLSVDPEQIDMRRFERLVGEGRRLATGSPEQAAERLQQALALWRGPPLDDFAGEEFVRDEIARLEELRLGAWEDRIDAELALGRHAEAVPELEVVVSQNPLRERLRAQLMLALYRCHRQADALAVYQEGRRLLADELGLEPGQRLRELERAILNQDPALDHQPAPTPPAQTPPTGTVTFLFTDIEGSTRLVQELGDDYGALLEQHHGLVRRVLAEHGGHEVDSQGDAFFFAFRRARDAVEAAVGLQRAVAAARWPQRATMRLRVGISTGEPGLGEAGYHGLDVVRAARIAASAHGEQILVSRTTRDLVPDDGVTFRDLGERRFKDLSHPEPIHQVVASGLREDFPEPRPSERTSALEIEGREEELAERAEDAVERAEEERRRPRRGLVLALTGVIVVAAAAVAAAVLTRGDGGAPTVVPNSLVKIDPKTNEIAEVVPVGRGPTSVAAVGRWLFTVNQGENTISRIDRRSGEVRTLGGIDRKPAGLTVDPAGWLWVGSNATAHVTRVDPASGVVTRRIRLPGITAPHLAVGDGSLWVSHAVPGGLVEITRRSLSTGVFEQRYSLEPFADVRGLAFGDSALWLALWIKNVLMRLDPDGRQRIIPVGFPAAPALAYRSVWIASRDEDRVYRVDPVTVEAEAIIQVGRDPGNVAVGADAVWVPNREENTISRIDPRSNAVVTTIATRYEPHGITIVDGAVWVAVSD